MGTDRAYCNFVFSKHRLDPPPGWSVGSTRWWVDPGCGVILEEGNGTWSLIFRRFILFSFPRLSKIGERPMSTIKRVDYLRGAGNGSFYLKGISLCYFDLAICCIIILPIYRLEFIPRLSHNNLKFYWTGSTSVPGIYPIRRDKIVS